MNIQPKDGDYVVVQSRWETCVRQVIKVSSSVYYYKDHYYNKERRARQDEIVFASADETLATRLSEQLKSSEAEFHKNCSDAANRRDRRDADFIAAASLPRHQSANPNE